jgi:colanic acid/amylovoran biosynthesis glycosyltransferase
VAYLVRRFPVLSQTFIAEEIADHLRAGLDVQIFSMESAPVKDAVEPIFRERVTYLGMPRSRAAKAAAFALAFAAPGRASAALRASRTLSGMGRRLQVDAAALALKLAPHLREVDVLHCHFGDVARVAAAALAGARANTRLAATFHGYDVTLARLQPLSRTYRHLLQYADLLLPVSRLWAGRLIEAGADERRTIVHHMGVDTARLAYVASKGRAGRLRLGMVGRMVEKKGHAIALAAIALLRRRRPALEVSLVLAGDGPLRPQIERMIEQLQLGDIVVSHGAMEHEQCLDLIRQSDAVLLPSVTSASGDMEGVPVVLMEAMALGRPVVSTRHSGIPELVEDELSGLLADEGDAEMIATAIERLADDPELQRSLSEQARSKVEREFDTRHLGQTLRAHYRSLRVVSGDA